jgi:hypothetical protein
VKSFVDYVDLQERGAAAFGRGVVGTSSFSDEEGQALEKLVLIAKAVARRKPGLMLQALERLAGDDDSIRAALKEIKDAGIGSLRRAAGKGNGLPSGDPNANADIIVPSSVDEPGSSSGFE